jgi:hypothetical protein
MVLMRQSFSLSFSNLFQDPSCAADLNLGSKWAGLLLISLVLGPGGRLLGHFSSCFVCRGSLGLLGFGPLVDH